MRRFKREVFKAGVITECKRRKFFENRQDEKKRKRHEAGRRNRRRSVSFTFCSMPIISIDSTLILTSIFSLFIFLFEYRVF